MNSNDIKEYFNPKSQFEKDQERTGMMIFIGIWVVMLGILFINSIQWERRLNEVDYCFEELADGSLYHYVCEK